MFQSSCYGNRVTPRFGARGRGYRNGEICGKLKLRSLEAAGGNIWSAFYDHDHQTYALEDAPLGDIREAWSAKHGCDDFRRLDVTNVELTIKFTTRFWISPWPVFSLVSLTTGFLPQRNLFPGDAPTTRDLNLFLSVPVENNDDTIAHYTPMWKGMLVDRVIAFLRATSHLKDLRRMDAARKDYKNVLVKENCPAEYMHNDFTNYEAMRKARCQLDVVCMNMWRSFFQTLDLDSTWFYIFCDASPQWKGTELFASSFDMLVYKGEALVLFKRRLLPQICIARNMYSTLGKCVSLL